MQKVLVISYFFPPCNLTASQRARSWANYLSKFGYFPVVVTRRWDHHIAHLSDVSRATPAEIKHEIHSNCEIYYLPYHANLRDKIYLKYKEDRFNPLRKALTFFELLAQPFLGRVIPYFNLYVFSKQYLAQHPDIRKMVISGNPFNLFKFGFQLHSKTGIKWIADYRDAWTTSEINMANKGFLHKLINRYDSFFEKKWVGTAALVTASSQPIASHVSALVGKKGQALYNGFVADDFKKIAAEKKFELFTITYVGTLYDGQKIEMFCEAFKRLIGQTPDARVRLLFPGLNFYVAQQARIERLMRGYEKYYECTKRMDRVKILEIEKRSHLLLHVAWDEHNGIIASKIYEYIASGTFILVTPTDAGAIQEIVQSSGCGICTKTVDETYNFLKTEYENYLAGKFRVNDTNSANVLQFSREKQVGKLAELLDKI